MKGLLFILLLVGFSIKGIRAQTTDRLGTIAGTLTDSLTGQPILFATVSLIRDDKPIDGTLSDSLGRFRLANVEHGNYVLRLSAVGYQSAQTPVWTVDTNHLVMDVGRLLLRPDVKTLQAVTVRGQKPLIEQRADGLTFNVESLPIPAGSDASDVLRKVPLLSVDANGGLSMRGSSRIRVFIDGKPSDVYAPSVADALKTIPGESIVRVEVITHPSARYDTEGTDGVVNIITRKLRDNATNGSISGAAGNRSEMLMGNVQSKYNQWIVKLDGFYQTYWNRNGSLLNREANSVRFVQRNETRQTGTFAFGGINALYSLDSLKTINVGYRLRHTPNRTRLASDNFSAENGRLRPTFHRDIDTPFRSLGHIFTTGYTQTSRDKRTEFSLLGIYFFANLNNRYDLSQTDNDLTPYRENSDSRTLNRELILQADYSRPLAQKGKWETGGKLTRKNLDSDSQFGIYAFDKQQYRNDPVRSNTFAYQSVVYALYTNFSFQINQWQFVTGLRYELTDLRATFKQASLRIPLFVNMAPNLLINRVLTKKSNVKLSYTVNLVRPFYAYLNPTINNTDSLNVQFGNPYLRPELTRRYGLTYSRNGVRLFTDVTLFYNHNQNSIEAIRTARPDGVFESTWQNVGRNRRLGTSVMLTWKPTPKINLNSTFTMQYVHLESPAMQLSNSGLTRQWVLNYNHKLPKGYSVDFYGFFDGKNIRLQGYRTGWKYYSLTVSKKSANERLNLSLRMDTPLTRHTFINEETIAPTFRQLYTYRYQNQNIRMTVSYKLGKKEIKNPRVRQAENPD